MSRPTLTGETLTVQQVRLTAAQIATARRLGDGNLSAGVRAALDRDALLRGLPWPENSLHASEVLIAAGWTVTPPGITFDAPLEWEP